MNCRAIAELLEGSALGALDADDSAALDTHLACCPRCASEIDRLGGIADLLAIAAPVIEPPARLKSRLMQSVRREARPSTIVPFRRKLAMAMTAAAVLVAFVVGGWSFSVYGELQRQRQVNMALAGELQGRDDLVQLVSSRPQMLTAMNPTDAAPLARGRVYASTDYNTALVMIENLPPLAEGRAYQVWLMKGGTRVSGGTFSVDASGKGKWLVHAPDPLNQYQAMSVTEEPAAGSEAPTTPRLLSGLF